MSFKILFMGTPEFAVPALKAINDTNHEILEVYTQPPKKKNRGQKIQNSAVHIYSNKLNIPVRCPENLNDNELDHIKKLKPDIVIVVAYGKILPENFLTLDKTNFINIHASLLPKWRGAAPIQRAIQNMDEETGISIMKIITELDAGPVLIQSKIKISKEDNFQSLSVKMAKLGGKLILDALRLIEKNKANFVEQSLNGVTYAKKIQKYESKINWNDYADKIIAKVNAFYPNPGCWFEYLGSRVKITRAIERLIKGKSGEVLDDKLTIACGKNAIQILELQKEGKKKMTADEFLKGNKIVVGQCLI